MRLIARICSIAALLLASQGCQADSQLLSQPNIEEWERQTLNADEEPATKQAEIKEPGRIKAKRIGWTCEIDDAMQDALIDPIENAAQMKQVWAVCHPHKTAPVVVLNDAEFISSPSILVAKMGTHASSTGRQTARLERRRELRQWDMVLRQTKRRLSSMSFT